MRYSHAMSLPRQVAALAALSILVAACANPVVSGAPGSTPATDPGASVVPSDAIATVRPPVCPSLPPAEPMVHEWWTDRVFYEVFVRSFADSDGDGIGDLQGLISRLDWLNDGDPATTDDLGITALWLMPVAESPSYHGYDVTDYLTVDPDYGTNDDFKALVAAAHERGIEVIVDLVMNHTSVDHPWFHDARTPGTDHDDWYVWADEYPGFSGPGGRPVWHHDGERWYYGYFWEGMPDLNLQNADVTAELDSIARFWVDDMGAAGFRLDAARHLIEDGSTLENTPATFDWLRGFRERLQAVTPDSLLLGEVWDATSVTSRYVRDGALDLTFDFDLAAQLLQAVKTGDAGSLKIIQAEATDDYPAGGYVAFLTNHDQDRTFDVVGRDVAKAKQAATLLLTSPGIPMLYYGEEIGLQGRKPDERIRTPMPWTGDEPGHGFTSADAPWEAMADGVETANVAVQTDDPDSLLSHYRTLIGLRADHPALRPGASIAPVTASDRSVYAILRHDPVSGESIIVVSNLSDEPIADVHLSLAEGPLCETPGVEPLFGATPGLSPPIGTPTGGLDDWSLGDLAPHRDVIMRLTP
jgi:alpha-amylase